jgi:ubiquinone biosynthesis protein UbiJ
MCRRAYNPCMLHTLHILLGTSVMERAVLLVNHVLRSEPVATARLAAHSGRRIELRFDGWPDLLPALPATDFRISAAGLVEWGGAGQADRAEPADLRITVDASNPLLVAAQALSGDRPRIDVAGDAVLATDVNWLFDNLRWDIEDDLAKLVGPAPAREAARVGGAIAAALRQAAQSLDALARGRRGNGGNGQPGR